MPIFTSIKAASAAAFLTAIKPIKKLIAVLFLCSVSINSLAQATVRDSAPVSSLGSAPASTSAVTSPQQSGNYNLIYQIQQMQQEVSELRGLLEEQNFQIKRLKQQRLDDYLDLDKRIVELNKQKQSNSSSSEAAIVAQNKNSDALSTLSGSQNLSGALANDIGAEKKLYRKAIDQLLNQQDYSGAQTSFTQYLGDYPSGTYAPNVHYWQGQIYLTDSNKEAAEKSFTALLNDYPDHQKAPDAKYKLATIFYDQGKKTEAKKMLSDVASSNSDASRLAKAFLVNQYK
ncbi:MAG: tol-pal system protein YbgF [Cellvibrionaceae bacterium]|jgi:tol-pal system protein YbgF